MAEQYDVQSQRRSVQVLSQTDARDVMEIGATTKPHGVFYLVDVPYDDWLKGFAAFTLGGIAEIIEQALGSGAAVGAYFVQDVDESGLLQNAIAFIVEVPNVTAAQIGPQRTTVTVPYNRLPLAVDAEQMFAPELAALTATASL